MSDFERAWKWREERGVLSETEAVRIFYGPGEGSGEGRQLAVDRFGDHYWITWWGDQWNASSALAVQLKNFLKKKNALSAVVLARPTQGLPAEPSVFLGSPPQERFEVMEYGVRFGIQLLGCRHPGLFLDHLPLRNWLRSRSRGWKVLNTFAYTGSLSVAAGMGGAEEVTTLDLSKPIVQWAESNWLRNALDPSRARFIAGDVFEWLPRLKRQGKQFDCVILDPPSFSHGKKGRFSTARDLPLLHGLAMDLLSDDGILVTSINSEDIPAIRFETHVLEAARNRKMEFEVLSRIDLPETFPTRLDRASDRYLKGLILRKR